MVCNGECHIGIKRRRTQWGFVDNMSRNECMELGLRKVRLHDDGADLSFAVEFFEDDSLASGCRELALTRDR